MDGPAHQNREKGPELDCQKLAGAPTAVGEWSAEGRWRDSTGFSVPAQRARDWLGGGHGSTTALLARKPFSGRSTEGKKNVDSVNVLRSEVIEIF